jgi:hypothetical protein
MRAEVEKALSLLEGKRLWTCRRAADMATFQFGKSSVVKDFYGKPTEVGEYALHVQCPWRIIQGDQIVVGSGDLYYPAQSSDHELPPADFNWDRDPNRRDEILRALFGAGEGDFIVRKIEVGNSGSFRLIFDSDKLLEVFPDDSLPHEHWRLLSPTMDQPHFVLTGAVVEA